MPSCEGQQCSKPSRKLELKRDCNKYYNKKKENPKDFFQQCNFSEKLCDAMGNYLPVYQNISKRVQTIVHQLIAIRNKILNIYLECRDEDEKYQLDLVYNKTDVSEFGAMHEGIVNSNFLKPQALWEIPVKRHNNEVYQGSELTEEEP